MIRIIPWWICSFISVYHDIITRTFTYVYMHLFVSFDEYCWLVVNRKSFVPSVVSVVSRFLFSTHPNARRFALCRVLILSPVVYSRSAWNAFRSNITIFAQRPLQPFHSVRALEQWRKQNYVYWRRIPCWTQSVHRTNNNDNNIIIFKFKQCRPVYYALGGSSTAPAGLGWN
jgi:hypothetical protein